MVRPRETVSRSGLVPCARAPHAATLLAAAALEAHNGASIAPGFGSSLVPSARAPHAATLLAAATLEVHSGADQLPCSVRPLAVRRELSSRLRL